MLKGEDDQSLDTSQQQRVPELRCYPHKNPPLRQRCLSTLGIPTPGTGPGTTAIQQLCAFIPASAGRPFSLRTRALWQCHCQQELSQDQAVWLTRVLHLPAELAGNQTHSPGTWSTRISGRDWGTTDLLSQSQEAGAEAQGVRTERAQEASFSLQENHSLKAPLEDRGHGRGKSCQETYILTEVEVTQAQGTRPGWHSGLESTVESSN